MATITFSNGQTVNFNGTPTPEDVDYVAKQLGITAQSTPQTPQQQGPSMPSQSSDLNPYVQNAGVPGELLNVGIGATNFLSDVGLGIGSTIGRTLYGLGSATASGVGAIAGMAGLPGVQKAAQGFAQNLNTIGSALPMPPTFGGGTGQVVGTGATLLAPGGAEMKLATKVGELAAGKGLGEAAQFSARALTRAGTGFATGDIYGLSQGQSAGDAAKTGGIFAGFGAGGEAFTALAGRIKGKLPEIMDLAFGTAKPFKNESMDTAIARQAQASKTLFKLNKENPINVGTKDNPVMWDPTKTTYDQFVKALNKAINDQYAKYTAEAVKAGNNGALFGKQDFQQFYDYLEGLKKNTIPEQKAAIQRLIDNTEENYPLATAGVKGHEVSPLDIQSYIENLNKPVEGTGTKSDIYQQASEKLREMMDQKIESATGAQYQAMRNTYRDLASLRDTAKTTQLKVMKEAGLPTPQGFRLWGLFNMVYGGATMALGNPGGAHALLRGAAETGLGAYLKYLGNSELALRQVFQIFADEGGATPPTGLVQTISRTLEQKSGLGSPVSNSTPQQ